MVSFAEAFLAESFEGGYYILTTRVQGQEGLGYDRYQGGGTCVSWISARFLISRDTAVAST
jgi:hypothetical protein